MKRLLFAPLLALVLVAGCDKKSKAVPQPVLPVQPQQPTTPTISAPAQVPEALKQRIAREWPEIEKMGGEFMTLFNEAKTIRASGDREALSALIDRANPIFQQASDRWAEIYYSVDDLDENTAEVCRKWMDSYDKKVHTWQVASKSLKEFSQAR
jgi:hypothetical protein